jgi:protoporphyrinogen oxidase
LAQSIAKPAYTRLLTAEPTLRRAVPTLIIAFLITICLGAFVQVVDQNRQKHAALKRDLAAIADLLAERLDRIAAVTGASRQTFAHVAEHETSLPSPGLGHADIVQAVDKGIAGSRVYVTGNFFGGLAIEDCVLRSVAEATRLVSENR